MKKNFVISVATMCSVLTLCSCHSDVLNGYEQEEAAASSVLHVFTRSDDPTVAASVPTPVCLYVFNSNGKCVKMLSDVTQNALVPVAGGSYDIYAIAGADASRYALPGVEEAQKTSVLTLKENQSMGELMTTHSTVTVADASEHNLTLTLTRAVTGIRQITIRQVPEAVTAVTVGVAPLHEAMAIDGSYSGTGGSYTATLTEEADGKTWSMAGGDDGPFFLPSAGKPTITVNFTSAEGTTSYSYSAAEELVANRKLSIEGTYTEQAKLKVTGTITGNDWDEDQAISFEFDETSSSGTSSGGSSETGGSESGGSESGSGSETTQTETMPEVGDLYKGKYYVLSVDEANNTILVFSPTERAMGINPSVTTSASAALQTLNAALETWEDNQIGEWRIPSYNEMSLIVNQKTSIAGKYSGYEDIAKRMYCFNRSNELSCFGCNNTTISGYDKTTTTTMLRPVATVTVPVSN
jgi:hypothetical protein